MVEFEPLTPDPPDPSYVVEVNGDTQQVNPSPDADRIVIETQQQDKTEYRTSTANIGSSYQPSVSKPASSQPG